MAEHDPGRIVTFYSYKGGTGRSMALANFAWLMAASGKRVLAIDWDLEAPGLHRYFRPFLADPDLVETDGLIDMFWNLTALALQRVSSVRELNYDNRGFFSADPDPSKAMADPDPIDIVDALEDGIRRLDWDFGNRGYIDFIGAGRQSQTYSERVNTFDWKRFYDLGGASLLTDAKRHLGGRYEWVVIDSRTGVSDTSGICTIQMPDQVVACFTMNRQSIDGVISVLGSIRNFRSQSVDGSKIEFFPLATRIENAEQDRLERARRYARGALSDFLPMPMQSRPREYWDQMEVAYRPAYAFEEVLAAFGDATDVAAAADSMLSQVTALGRCVSGDPSLRIPEIGEAERGSVLGRYTLGGAAEVGERSVGTAAETGFLRGLRAKEQEWRDSRFDWRRLLSRRELDMLTDQDRTTFGRDMTFYVLQSEKIHKYFRTIDLTFVSIWLISITTTIGFSVITLNSKVFYFERYWNVDLIKLYSIFLLSIFVFSWLMGSAVAGRSPGKPHGVRFGEVFRLTFRGPFRRDIKDFEGA